MSSKKTMWVVVMCVALVALMSFGTFVSSAEAVEVAINNLSSSIDLPGFNFSYSTYTADGKTDFSAYMTNSDRISTVSAFLEHDTSDPAYGWVNVAFYGTVGDTPGVMDQQGQRMDVNRHGVGYGAYVSLGSYQETIWPYPIGAEPQLGDWLSQGWGSVTLSDVTPTWSDCNYSENTDPWSGDTYFNGLARWHVRFDSLDVADAYSNLGQVSVPEPATMSLLGLGLLGIIARRRRRS